MNLSIYFTFFFPSFLSGVFRNSKLTLSRSCSFSIFQFVGNVSIYEFIFSPFLLIYLIFIDTISLKFILSLCLSFTHSTVLPPPSTPRTHTTSLKFILSLCSSFTHSTLLPPPIPPLPPPLMCWVKFV